MEGIFTMMATGKSSGRATGASACEAKRFWNPQGIVIERPLAVKTSIRIYCHTLSRKTDSYVMYGEVLNCQVNVFDISDK